MNNVNIRMNLQLFAGEKTEKATPKKKKDARDKGQVLQSKEINTAAVLLTVFVAINFLKEYWYKVIKGFYISSISRASHVDTLFTVTNIRIYALEAFLTILKIALPVLMVAMLVGVIISYVQVGFLFTTKTLQFKLSRINPISGAKKLFSLKALFELMKALLKTGVLLYITGKYLAAEYLNLLKVIDMSIVQIMSYMWKVVFNIAMRGAAVLFTFSVFDYMFKKYDYEKELKMSKHEVKEEFKQMEGDPQIKSKIKQRQREMAMSRMMQDVPSADVIITNPTHYAVALAYKEEYGAPIILAKGMNLVAQRIKEIAKDNDVEIVENKPLARKLYGMLDVGDHVPEELYHAVAEVLAYVYGLKNNR